MRILVGSVLVMLCFAQDSPKKPNGNSHDNQTQANCASPSPVTVNCNQSAGNEAQRDSQEAPKGNTPIESANWALVIVGVITAVAVWYQANKTAESTTAIRETTDLQKAGMRQWIDVEPKAIDFDAVVSHPFKVDISFLAINNTNYPLTITKIETKVSIRAEEWEVFTMETHQTVPPRGSKENTYPFYLPMKSADYVGSRSDWREKRVLTINGTIGFRDCLERADTQEFSGLYRCDPTGIEYMKPLGIVPVTRTEREEHEAI